MTNENIGLLKKFFWPKEEVQDHWYEPLDNFEFSSDDFYQMIEKELQVRRLPGLELSRVNFSEGGVLSNKREYLRIKRKRLVFDICASPFGTSYFFSFRAVHLPLGIRLTELIIFLVGAGLFLYFLAKMIGTIYGIIAFFGIIFSCIYEMRNSLALGLKDLDANLLKTPVIGPLYELCRKETYHQEDTRHMYVATVKTVTEMLVDEIVAKNGIKLVRRYERRPIHGELYREKIISSDKKAEPPFQVVA